ncbi:MAG TPA: DUF1990 domain-containing protein [Mycobacteriales bacterium]|nr:DUF1990 domain-containing protein [Mycobacteriales bacterium]
MSSLGLSHDEVGATDPAAARWLAGPRRFETTIKIGHGDQCWATSREAVMSWAVKTRSGFKVKGGPARAVEGHDYELVFRVGALAVREPVRVVAVVDERERCGFAYGTRPGHPVSGEEAFIVHRDSTGAVHLTLRSLTMPATGRRRVAFPLFVAAQPAFRRRYLRALTR